MSLFRRKKECHHCYFFDMAEADVDVFHGTCRLKNKALIENSEKESCEFHREPTPFLVYVNCHMCGRFKPPEVRKIKDKKWRLVIDLARCSNCHSILDSGVKPKHPTDEWRDK